MFELPFNHKPEIVSGVEEEKCAKILKDFFAELREKKKEMKRKMNSENVK